MGNEKDEPVIILVDESLGYDIRGMADADAGRNWIPPRPPNLPKPTSNETKLVVNNSQPTVKSNEKKQ